MKLRDIMAVAIEEGIREDPRTRKEITWLLKERRKAYEKLTGVRREIFDKESLTSPFADSRLLYGAPGRDINQAWVGIGADTADLLLVREMTAKTRKKPLVISHHPLGRGAANFYEVMDMQADMLAGAGVAQSVADNLTRRRKAEVARRVSASNEQAGQDAARILDLPLLCLHTPADNHVQAFVTRLFERKKPRRLDDLVDLLLGIEEYKIAAKQGKPPAILCGDAQNKCGKIFVDMTGGTGGDTELVKHLVQSGVSTIVTMHMSDDRYKLAGESHINVVIAGHISSDNLGVNLLLDKILAKLGPLEIVPFQGFRRVSRL